MTIVSLLNKKCVSSLLHRVDDERKRLRSLRELGVSSGRLAVLAQDFPEARRAELAPCSLVYMGGTYRECALYMDTPFKGTS